MVGFWPSNQIIACLSFCWTTFFCWKHPICDWCIHSCLLKVIFYGFYHGIHHHVSPPFGKYFGEFFFANLSPTIQVNMDFSKFVGKSPWHSLPTNPTRVELRPRPYTVIPGESSGFGSVFSWSPKSSFPAKLFPPRDVFRGMLCVEVRLVARSYFRWCWSLGLSPQGGPVTRVRWVFIRWVSGLWGGMGWKGVPGGKITEDSEVSPFSCLSSHIFGRMDHIPYQPCEWYIDLHLVDSYGK